MVVVVLWFGVVDLFIIVVFLCVDFDFYWFELVGMVEVCEVVCFLLVYLLLFLVV